MTITAATHATAQPPGRGLTMGQYAEDKKLPVDFLAGLGVTEHVWADGHPYLRMPYLDENGELLAARMRHSMTEGFSWRSGDHAHPYGLPFLASAREVGYLVVPEGESDFGTLRFHGVPALALPGAATWKPAWDDYLEGFEIVYVVIEPDQGGEAMRHWVSSSRARERVRFIEMPADCKDPSALHIASPEHFDERWAELMDAAVPWSELDREETAARLSVAHLESQALIGQPDILRCFVNALHAEGVVGEARAAMLLFLCAVSRLLTHPVSAVVKGPSSAGKSFITDAVLRYFPSAAYYVLTAMSERALVYTEEEFEHRIIVINEAKGLGEFAEYLVRSYQSEGHLRYETVETTAQGIKPRVIEKQGPIALILTTTAVSLHKENETRQFSIPVTDTPEQTKAIFLAQADEAQPDPDRYRAWHALQEVLAAETNQVTIPFASVLAQGTIPAGVRMRRDFRALLTLVRAHALLLQESRERDLQARIIATPDDYAAVHELVADLIGEGVQAAVPRTVRETVEAVVALQGMNHAPVNVTKVAQHLGIDKSSASRRVKAAIALDYLANDGLEGRPARLTKDEDLPEERLVLPTPEQLRSCMVAHQIAGETPSPLPLDVDEVEEHL